MLQTIEQNTHSNDLLGTYMSWHPNKDKHQIWHFWGGEEHLVWCYHISGLWKYSAEHGATRSRLLITDRVARDTDVQFSGFVGYVRECVECLKELNVDGAADGALAELRMSL